MIGRRTIAAGFLLSLLLAFVAPAARAQEAPIVRVRDLSRYLQKVVTVQGRTGYIAERYEQPGLHAFTLRDDYNDQVIVRTMAKDYPVMGVTYRVTGWATREKGVLFLDTLKGNIVPAYSSAPPPRAQPFNAPLLLGIAAALASLAALAALIVVVVRVRARALPEWGEMTVASGPDKGKTMSLRRRRIPLGRGVSALRGIRLSGGDTTISNLHAVLQYRNGALYYIDMSRNGSRIGGERLKSGAPTRINSGDLIHLGTQGTVIIVRLRDVAPTPGFWDRLREPAPLAEQTVMFPDQPAEDPSWTHTPDEAPAHDEHAAAHAPADQDGDGSDPPEATDMSARPLFSFVSVSPRDRPAPSPADHADSPEPWNEEEVA
ncbi:MAG: FHA domain-containing protein [Armatimonadetes bacterium]|nr:FHA domain-containing protein [Armatimonadota bacterium]